VGKQTKSGSVYQHTKLTVFSFLHSDGLDLESHKTSIEWLKDNKDPWNKCVALWKETSKARVRQLEKSAETINECMETYPGLKDKSGYLLVSDCIFWVC